MLLDHYHERAAHAKRMFAKERASLSDGAGPHASSLISQVTCQREVSEALWSVMIVGRSLKDNTAV